MTKAIVVFDIDGVVRDVSSSYRRAIADTVEHFTDKQYRPTITHIDKLKSEGYWNNDWEASQELIYRYLENLGRSREEVHLNYDNVVAFFQSRYRGTDSQNFNGYICDEPLLLQASYLDELTEAGISWGFFSGATRGSAKFLLEGRLGLKSPVLVAMEDSPGKPDPTGLFATVDQLLDNVDEVPAVMYVGDTVADMYTVEKARSLKPNGKWVGVGVLPPHVQENSERRDAYTQTLLDAGAVVVLNKVTELTSGKVRELLS
ncbi:MAG: TIGR01548 family HAD-type hydrolase [Scytonematopsis contorta HA4267-MV1]|jgi:HAD superfamily phosphatase|nr:TIGR01548 family HAD-type hydrolase [Scytonematopsis contorta HA4267-MV1]